MKLFKTTLMTLLVLPGMAGAASQNESDNPRPAFAPGKEVMKAIADTDIIYEAPEGKVIPMVREGRCYYDNYGTPTQTLYYGEIGEVVECDNNEVYLKDPMGFFFTHTYLKGHKEGNEVVFDLPQTIYAQKDETDPEIVDLMSVSMLQYVGDTYAMPGSKEAVEYGCPEIENKLVLKIDENGTYYYEGDYGYTMFGMVYNETGDWAFYADGYSYWNEFLGEEITVPDNLQPEVMTMIYDNRGNNVEVAFDGDDVYFRGLFISKPEQWVKAKKDGDKVTIVPGQYVGTYLDIYYMYVMTANVKMEYDESVNMEYKIYEPSDSFTFIYDADKKEFFPPEMQAICLNRGNTDISSLNSVESPRILIQPADFPKIPRDPYDIMFYPSEPESVVYFNLPVLSTDGYLLDVNHLYYCVYINGEEYIFDRDDYINLPEPTMLYIPYMLTDGYDFSGFVTFHTLFLYEQGIETLGLQLVYLDDDGNVLGASNIVNVTSTGIADTVEERTVASRQFFDISGRKIENPGKGIFIEVVRYDDGTSKATKIAR